MFAKEGVAKKRETEFREWFMKAAAIELNVKCLQGVAGHVAEGNGMMLKQVLGPQVTLTDTPETDQRIDYIEKFTYAISILKPYSAELYLKALLASEGKLPSSKRELQTHDLLRLHDALGFKSKNQINEQLTLAISSLEAEGRQAVQYNNFRSIVDFHRHDFVSVRYTESDERRQARLRDGMFRLDAVLRALKGTCLCRPEASAWWENIQHDIPDDL